MKKDTKVYLILVVIIILIIGGIFYWKSLNKEALDKETAICISGKAVMYSQTSCSHCIVQKKMLGNYLNIFNITECDENEEENKKCSDAGIIGTPTWIIDGKKIEGIQTIAQLKELTRC